MDEESFDSLESQLQSLVGEFQFPPTPDVWDGFHRRAVGRRSPIAPPGRWAWAAMAVLLALVVLAVSVPTVRATVSEFLEQGAVRILLGGEESKGGISEGGEAPSATGTELTGLDLAGETSLQEAESTVPFPITQPAYPPDLGPADHVYLQNSDGWIVIQVWEDRTVGNRLALYAVEHGAFITKEDPPVLRRVSVDGDSAIWTEGAHFLQVEAGGLESRRLVRGHVLIWTPGEVTYRLETNLPLGEAIKVAESVR